MKTIDLMDFFSLLTHYMTSTFKGVEFPTSNIQLLCLNEALAFNFKSEPLLVGKQPGLQDVRISQDLRTLMKQLPSLQVLMLWKISAPHFIHVELKVDSRQMFQKTIEESFPHRNLQVVFTDLFPVHYYQTDELKGNRSKGSQSPLTSPSVIKRLLQQYLQEPSLQQFYNQTEETFPVSLLAGQKQLQFFLAEQQQIYRWTPDNVLLVMTQTPFSQVTINLNQYPTLLLTEHLKKSWIWNTPVQFREPHKVRSRVQVHSVV